MKRNWRVDEFLQNVSTTKRDIFTNDEKERSIFFEKFPESKHEALLECCKRLWVTPDWWYLPRNIGFDVKICTLEKCFSINGLRSKIKILDVKLNHFSAQFYRFSPGLQKASDNFCTPTTPEGFASFDFTNIPTYGNTQMLKKWFPFILALLQHNFATQRFLLKRQKFDRANLFWISAR